MWPLQGDELVALGGPKPFLGTLGSSSCRSPTRSWARAPVWSSHALALGRCPSRRRGPCAQSVDPARSCSGIGDPSLGAGSPWPVLRARRPPGLQQPRGDRRRPQARHRRRHRGTRAPVGWDAGVGRYPIAQKLPPGRESDALATNLTRSWDPPRVDPPPLELSPNSTRS